MLIKVVLFLLGHVLMDFLGVGLLVLFPAGLVFYGLDAYLFGVVFEFAADLDVADAAAHVVLKPPEDAAEAQVEVIDLALGEAEHLAVEAVDAHRGVHRGRLRVAVVHVQHLGDERLAHEQTADLQPVQLRTVLLADLLFLVPQEDQQHLDEVLVLHHPVLRQRAQPLQHLLALKLLLHALQTVTHLLLLVHLLVRQPFLCRNIMRYMITELELRIIIWNR